MGLFDSAKNVAKSFDPTTKEGLTNIGVAVGTGGMSLPVQVAGGVAGGLSNLDPTKIGKADTSGVAREQEAYRQKQEQLQKQQQQIMQGRTAPQVAMPTDIQRGQILNVQPSQIAATMPVAGEQIQYSGSPMEQQALEMQRQQALGEGPQVAPSLLRSGFERSAKQAMALAGSRGYDPSAIRGAQYQMSEADQAAALEASQLAAQQQIAGQQGLLSGAQAQAAAQQAMAQRQAEINQQANMFNSTQEGQMALAQADNALKAQLANQGVDLEVLKTNAARGDAFALANLEAQLKQMGLDDALTLGYLANITTMDANLLQSELELFKSEQARQTGMAQTRTGLIGGVLQAGGAVAGKAITGGA